MIRASAFVVLSALCASMSVTAAAQEPAPAQKPYSPPRTADGHPDFTGEWSNKFLTPFEKAATLPDLVATPAQEKMIVAAIRKAAKTLGDLANDPEAGEPDAYSLTKVRGEFRTRQVVEPADGMMPLTPEGAKKVNAYQAKFTQLLLGKADDPEGRLIWERCLGGMGQAPLLTAWAINANRRLVQTRDALVINSEAGGDTRIIRIGGKPLPGALRSFTGDSVGHWEGDTLVAETTGFRPDDQFRIFISGRPILVSPDSKVVERFTRVSDDEIDYQFTVLDPATYSAPWLAEYAMTKSTEPMYEFACHEGNYALPNILRGQREIERRAAEAKAGKP